MAGKNLRLLRRADLPEHQGFIRAGGQDLLAVSTEDCRPDGVFVADVFAALLRRTQVPEANTLIGAGRCEQLAIGTEGETRDGCAAMTVQAAKALAARGVVQANDAILA